MKIDSQDIVDAVVRIVNEVVEDAIENPEKYRFDPGDDDELREEWTDAGNPVLYAEKYYEVEDAIRNILKEEFGLGDTDSEWHTYEVRKIA